MEEPFLCLPLFPAPRLWRVYFQVGFHFHLQVSDKSRQAPALSHSARGGRERGGTRAPTGVGSRTALWSGFLAFRPSCLKGLCIYFLKKTAKPTALVDTRVPVFYPPFHPHINFLARRLSFQKRVWAVGGGAGAGRQSTSVALSSGLCCQDLIAPGPSLKKNVERQNRPDRLQAKLP